MQQACWSGPPTISLGTCFYPYADEPPLVGDVVACDAVTKAASPAGATVFGQRYGNGMACRADGAVAIVDALPPATDARTAIPGELVVIRRDGTRTVLGRDYQRVFAL